MPTRSYYFPKDFKHLEEILIAEPGGFSEDKLAHSRELGLPPIPSVGSLPLFLGISSKTIFSIRRQPRKHYRSFSLKKKDGTRRQIDTPRTYLKVVQWWILDNILNHVQIADNIFGFVSGRSAIQNAEYHFGASHILNVDIKQFFPSITIKQVKKIFRSLGYSDEVAEMLSELCCLDDRVPQGAPTSPALANLVLRDLDEELSKIALDAKYKYSRYADDLTFSSREWIDAKFFTAVEKAVKKEGFNLKPEKTRYSGMEGRMEITGIVINEKLQPSRAWRKRVRAKIHQFGRYHRLTRKDLSYLFGIKGIASQFEASPQMQQIFQGTRKLLEDKSHTVIGMSERPIIPNKLTLRQAETLVALGPRKTNAEIAIELKKTEAAVKKQLQEAFRKIEAADREEAYVWASKNL